MTTRKSGLGRGLGALIPTDLAESAPGHDAPVAEGTVLEVPVASVRPNRHQPRTHFDEESLAGLTASIAEIGVLQPVLVRLLEDGTYELIAGERRWRASKRAGRQTIPVVVRQPGTDADMLEHALVENLHRSDLNPMEEAAAYQQLVEDFGLTQEAVAKRVGKSRAAVSNTLRLFQLPPRIQALVAENQLSAGHARALLGTPDRAFQSALADRIVRDGLSVRETEDAVRARQGGDEGDAAPESGDVADRSSDSESTRSESGTVEPGFLELQELLAEHFDTRVKISGGKGTGSIAISFADLEDLERIYRIMVESR